ncbi:hypothetical protein AMTRI_Chr03g145580 [Amborella trichopoda]
MSTTALSRFNPHPSSSLSLSLSLSLSRPLRSTIAPHSFPMSNALRLHFSLYKPRSSLSLFKTPLTRIASVPPLSLSRKLSPKISAITLDELVRRVKLKEVLRTANEGLENLIYSARIGAQRLDRRFSLSLRFERALTLVSNQTKLIDREYGISQKSKAFTMDIRRNWPRYRKQLNEFLETPLGKLFATLVFLWFALSGWLFRFLILATWVLPFAAPLLIGTVANNLVIEGACPACKRRFMGYRSQVIRCVSCGSIVWQPKDRFSRGPSSSSSSADSDVIDVEIEEK